MGSQQYYQAHKAEAANYSILLESDEGVFTPYGMRFTGSNAAKQVEIMRSFSLGGAILYVSRSEPT